ncbi:MAG: ATP-binding protein [Pirellulales bacterium]
MEFSLEQLLIVLRVGGNAVEEVIRRGRKLIELVACAAQRSSVEVALASDRSLEEYKELLELILNECAKLGLLVNQLLLLAETDAELRLPTSAYSSIAWPPACSTCSRPGRGARHRAAGRPCPRCLDRGHPTRLRQVVNNLIENALKFTPEKGRVSARLSTDREVALAVLTVADTGTGIQPTDLPHIFDRFYRGETARPRRPRHGAGAQHLPIDRRSPRRTSHRRERAGPGDHDDGVSAAGRGALVGVD